MLEIDGHRGSAGRLELEVVAVAAINVQVGLVVRGRTSEIGGREIVVLKAVIDHGDAFSGAPHGGIGVNVAADLAGTRVGRVAQDGCNRIVVEVWIDGLHHRRHPGHKGGCGAGSAKRSRGRRARGIAVGGSRGGHDRDIGGGEDVHAVAEIRIADPGGGVVVEGPDANDMVFNAWMDEMGVAHVIADSRAVTISGGGQEYRSAAGVDGVTDRRILPVIDATSLVAVAAPAH